MAGVTYNIIRKMNMTLPVIYSPFYNAISGVFVVIIFYWKLNLSQLGLSETLLLTLGCLGDLIGQLTMSMALKYGEASKITPFLYLMIVFGLVFDVLLMHYSFSGSEILGCAVILVSILTPPVKNYFNH